MLAKKKDEIIGEKKKKKKSKSYLKTYRLSKTEPLKEEEEEEGEEEEGEEEEEDLFSAFEMTESWPGNTRGDVSESCKGHTMSIRLEGHIDLSPLVFPSKSK